MSNISFGERIRRERIKNAWTQVELGEKLEVSQAMVSNWEIGRVLPNREQKDRMREVLGLHAYEPKNGQEEVPNAQADQEGPSAFGSWLNKVRLERRLSVAEVASKAGVSAPAIYNIESGRIGNPREETVRRLEKAVGLELPAETKKETRDEATVEGVGEFFEFDPHNKNDWPGVAGIYVLYDVSERPIYVGQGSNIKNRIGEHEEKFWFRPPIVTTAAYIKVDESALRRKIESILIRFLKRNAVINKQNVER